MRSAFPPAIPSVTVTRRRATRGAYGLTTCADALHMAKGKVSDTNKNGAYLKKQAFLAAYAASANMKAAAQAAGINRSSHYSWLKADDSYRGAWDSMQEEAAQTLEDEAVRRAHDGVKRPVMYKGKPVHVGRRILYDVEYSDQLLIMLLKRFRPALYREHISAEVSGTIQIAERLQAANKRLIEMRKHDGNATG